VKSEKAKGKSEKPNVKKQETVLSGVEGQSSFFKGYAGNKVNTSIHYIV
jgi:hypothetical protein